MPENYLKEMTTIYGESGTHFIPLDWNATYWEPHWHECMEITLVHRGVVSSTVEGRLYTVSAGQALLIPPKAVHSGGSLVEGTLYNTVKIELSEFLNGTKAASKCIQAFMECRIALPTVTDDPNIIAPIKEMIEANQKNRQFSIVASFYKLLDAIYTESSSGGGAGESGDFFDVLHYIKTHLSSPLSTSDICRKFNYNETYFCRKFKSHTGQTVTRYILLHRLENACRLMRGENRPIGDICVECGFSDFSYFCSAFKRVYGLSPTKYRERLKTSPKTHTKE